MSDELIRRSLEASAAGYKIVRKNIALYYAANIKTRDKAATDAINNRQRRMSQKSHCTCARRMMTSSRERTDRFCIRNPTI